MMEFSFAAFALMALVVIMVPGPTVLLAFSNGSRFGFRHAGYGILGAAVSDVVLITAAALGLGALMTVSALWFNIVKWIGVAYILWLGIQMVRSTEKLAITSSETRIPKLGNHCEDLEIFKKSFLVAVTNPKGYVFFTAFLPQFLNASKPLHPQYVTLAIIFIAVDVVVMMLYAGLGVKAMRFLSDRGTLWIDRTCGIILLTMASTLALLRRSEI